MAYNPLIARQINTLLQDGLTLDQALGQVNIAPDDEAYYVVDEVGTPDTNANFGRVTDIQEFQVQTTAAAEFETAPELLDAIESGFPQEVDPFEAGFPEPEPEPFEVGFPAPVEPFEAGFPEPEPEPFEAGFPAPVDDVFESGYPDPDPLPPEPFEAGFPAPVDAFESGYPAPDPEPFEVGFPPGDATGIQESVTRNLAREQATIQARFKQPGNGDWRLRISLAPSADYLYAASNPGILAPLRPTNGVIFPYTPTISTSYQASYDQYELVHSNFRGAFYKSSKVADISVSGVFTAQDTQEAAYLLAVIHFFRSVTKMFYGKDAQRGTPPPLVYMTGMGPYQFNNHSCVVTNFSYSLPNDVDYIRATNPNNFGSNLLNRRQPIQSSPGGINFSGAIRLANALLPKGAQPLLPNPGVVDSTVSNLGPSTYVPTRMNIELTLMPMQTRNQVSKQFSLKDFANGNLLRGGFW